MHINLNSIARWALTLPDGPEQQWAYMRKCRRQAPATQFILIWDGWRDDPREVHEIHEIRRFCDRLLHLGREKLLDMLVNETHHPEYASLGFGRFGLVACAAADVDASLVPKGTPRWVKIEGGSRLMRIGIDLLP